MTRTGTMWLCVAIAASLSGIARCQPTRPDQSPRALPGYMPYVAQLEAASDYASYKAAAPSERYHTTFYDAIARLLAPDRYLPHSGPRFPQDEGYATVMNQRAAIFIAQREKWVPLVPFLLQYLDYAENMLAGIRMGRLFGPRWQYPSMAVEAILSFGPDALPFLEESALDKRFRPELRLGAVALMVEIDEQHAEEVGTRLQGDAFLDPDRLNGVLQGSVTAADIAYSLAHPPKPKASS